VKLVWLWAEDSEREKEKRARHDDRLLLKRRWGRQGRGGGPGCGTVWKSNGAERGGRGSATWTGMARTWQLRLTGRGGRCQAPVAATGCGRERERAGQHGARR
jgi:hypothetical protein